jgi:hypothetical protein
VSDWFRCVLLCMQQCGAAHLGGRLEIVHQHVMALRSLCAGLSAGSMCFATQWPVAQAAARLHGPLGGQARGVGRRPALPVAAGHGDKRPAGAAWLPGGRSCRFPEGPLGGGTSSPFLQWYRDRTARRSRREKCAWHSSSAFSAMRCARHRAALTFHR